MNTIIVLKHLILSKTVYVNKEMWRADRGKYQFEAIDKGKTGVVRIDVYKYRKNIDDEIVGSYVESETFSNIEDADKFVDEYDLI